MELPINTFKRALRAQRHQTGLWVTLGHPNSTETVSYTHLTLPTIYSV